MAFIRRLKVFDDVTFENCNAIVSRASKKLLSRNQTIFSVGDPVEHVVLLLSGCVKITRPGPRGNKAILRLIGFGEFVGTFGLSSECKYGSTAQVVP
jgi:CRP-like cAMP-binding protein